MYNMYCRHFTGPTYGRIATKHEKEKYYHDSTANGKHSHAQNNFLCVPHEEVSGSTSGQGKQLLFFKVFSNLLQILYYI